MEGKGRGGERKGWKESGREMEGLLIRGGRGGEKRRGRVPLLLWFPLDLGLLEYSLVVTVMNVTTSWSHVCS